MNRAVGNAIPAEPWERLGTQEMAEVLGRRRCVLDELRRTA